MNRAEILEILTSRNFWTKEQNTGVKRKEYIKKLEGLSKNKIFIKILAKYLINRHTLGY